MGCAHEISAKFSHTMQKAYSAVAIDSCFEILVSPGADSQMPDLQSRFSGRYGRQLTAQVIQNRLHTAKLGSHKAAGRSTMTALYRQACWQHTDWNFNMLGMLSSAISPDRRVKVWRTHRERYADCCTNRVTFFH